MEEPLENVLVPLSTSESLEEMFVSHLTKETLENMRACPLSVEPRTSLLSDGEAAGDCHARSPSSG